MSKYTKLYAFVNGIDAATDHTTGLDDANLALIAIPEVVSRFGDGLALASMAVAATRHAAHLAAEENDPSEVIADEADIEPIIQANRIMASAVLEASALLQTTSVFPALDNQEVPDIQEMLREAVAALDERPKPTPLAELEAVAGGE